jgi:hypothetical protein
MNTFRKVLFAAAAAIAAIADSVPAQAQAPTPQTDTAAQVQSTTPDAPVWCHGNIHCIAQQQHLAR